MDKTAQMIAEDLNIQVGLGITESVGSDSYPFYVSEILPNGVIGIVRAKSHFDEAHPWQGGTEVVEPFDPSQPTEFYAKRRYGNWWMTTKEGKPLNKWSGRWNRVRFGKAVGYRDPSF